MPLRRRHRLLTALIVLISLLSMQVALASYQCRGMVTQVVGSAQTASAMDCADSMADGGADQAGLCHAHCQTEHQSADSYQLPDLPVLPAPTLAHVAARHIAVPPCAPLQAPLLRRSTAPPLAIQHCCFRI